MAPGSHELRLARKFFPRTRRSWAYAPHPALKNERIFAGVSFIDGRWGKNYVPYEPYIRRMAFSSRFATHLRMKIDGSVRD